MYAKKEPWLANGPKEAHVVGFNTKTGQEGWRGCRRHFRVCRVRIRRDSIKRWRENGPICQEPSTVHAKHDGREGIAQDEFTDGYQECYNAAKEVESASAGLTMSVSNS